MAGLGLHRRADITVAACRAGGSGALTYALPGQTEISPLRCTDCGNFSGSLSDLEVVEHAASEGQD
ncbi:hypothetical protein [Bradyrhizobium sp. WD16]|uniref:hypothetical protein n=1 Tax=Bradyrhizobium sp. WD16 TaxID=1521768 RepID=UPI0020A346BA|nr:hypothetical protein [Bradyrhizobium sp. WD16]